MQPSVNKQQLSALLQELSDQQQFTNGQFETLRLENEDLIQQLERLQNKHEKQQNTVQRLITFIISFMQNKGVSTITDCY